MVTQQQFVTKPVLTDSSQFSTARFDVKGTGDDITLTVYVGEDLDFLAKDTFKRAIAEAQRSLNACVVVDLENTKRIDDSGLELLSMLNTGCWRMSRKVRIVNCSADLECRFAGGLERGVFDLSGECSTLVKR
jgi:anti-anti-sigma regulatory factor